MIVLGLCEVVYFLLNMMFSLVPDVPAVPEIAYAYFEALMNYVSLGSGFLSLIVPVDLVVPLLLVLYALENFDFLYSFVMWVLKKIPFLGMQ